MVKQLNESSVCNCCFEQCFWIIEVIFFSKDFSVKYWYECCMGKIPVSRVAELRKQAGLTQRELALQVDVTESTISNWEKGRNCLEWFERVARLCKALNCTPDELISYMPIPEDEDS